MKLILKQGSELVKLARASIEGKELKVKGFEANQGVFVTLNSYPSNQLRGCIGFPEPVMQLKKAIIEAAKAAAFHDPRFPPLTKDEKFVVEVSVLTVPEEIKVKDAKEYPKHVKIGEDGLIVEYDGRSGLLLPQVFPEWNATPETALDMTCEKAGLPKEFWKTGKCKFYKFQAQIFKEEKPNGNIVEEKQ
ncbi:MAG TPA: TIGR00296 family protein [Nanoarchaeota archaeon]|nr:TIGR00296 family protein [Nanoarchaeota archaeon]